MPGYSQMNSGYNEQYAIPWGKVAAYGVGGVAAAGAIRMGSMKMRNSSMYHRGRSALSQGRGYAGAAGSAVLPFASGGWRGMKGRASSFYGNMAATGFMGAHHRIGQANRFLANRAANRVGRNATSAAEALRGGKAKILAGGGRSVPMRGGTGATHRTIGTPSRALMADQTWKGKTARAGMAAYGFFGAGDFYGQGAKRLGVMAGRGGLAGLGLAALDGLNPFGLGWND